MTADQEHVDAVSLLAELEAAAARDGHAALLPFLGMARAELTDFGQRSVKTYVAVKVHDVHAATAELCGRLTEMHGSSPVPQHQLRIEAALRWLHRGVAACGPH